MEDEILGRLEDKIDRVSERIGGIDITLAAQHENLKEHMRRTDAVEQTIGIIREKQIEPMVRKWAMAEGVLKLIGTVSLVAGIVEGAVALLEYARHIHG